MSSSSSAQNSDEKPTADSDMPALKVNPERAAQLIENITSIRSRITQTVQSSNIQRQTPPRLVAVSKLKPATDILALHQPPSHKSISSDFSPQVHFGENYVQELVEKSRLLPSSIRWHFIGGLQSNKCVQLARDVKGLWAVESVDSEKKARQLDKGWSERKQGKSKTEDVQDGEEDGEAQKLNVFVQVNTSGEESKSGLGPKSKELSDLCVLIRDELENLNLQGLMTIGAIARSQATTAGTENEDFVALRDNKEWLEKECGFAETNLELSMGMSEDFEGAIVQGSDEVRVGSTIFGERPPKKEAKVLEGVEEGKEKS